LLSNLKGQPHFLRHYSSLKIVFLALCSPTIIQLLVYLRVLLGW
jgi:hypothetical protein